MRYILFFLLLMAVQESLKAQITMPYEAWSIEENLSLDGIENYELPAFNNNALNEKFNADCDGKCGAYAKLIKVNIDPHQVGTWRSLEDGRKIWRLKLSSPTALGFKILSNQFHLTEGVRLFFYDIERSNIYGAYSHHNAQINNRFTSSAIYENPLIMELNIEAGISDESWELVFNALGYIFTDAADIGNSLECNDDVICQPWWADWCNEIRSVVKLDIKQEVQDISAGEPGFPEDTIFVSCSGAVVNDLDNLPQDFSELKIITANHCAVGRGLNQFARRISIDPEEWLIYYNFQRPVCNDSSVNGNDKMTTLGVEILYRSSEFAASPYADYCPDISLLQVTDKIPYQYNLYYAGWTIADTDYELASLNTTIIHHPGGDLKKIGDGEIVGGTKWNDDCWEIDMDNGIVQGVSSGAPHFENESQRIIGIQSYNIEGGANCEDNNEVAAGKFARAWSDGMKNHVGNYAGTDGADPFQACLNEMSISGFMYPSLDWQTKRDITVQARKITSPADTTLTARVTQSTYQANTYADYTFRAVDRVKLIPGFKAERNNRFKATIGACEPFEDCGFNYKTAANSSKKPLSPDIESDGNLQLYPNPTSGELQIILPASGGLLRLYDATGRLLKSSNEPTNLRIEWNLDQLQAGMYLVQWQKGDEVQTQKLIVR